MTDLQGAIEPEPMLVPRVWGGDGLAGLGRRVPSGTVIGESWDLADLPADAPGGRSRIARGPGAGGTLRELIEADPAGVLGRARPGEDGGFPLLVKLLDARQDLSVQVHPTPSYAARHPEARVKSEAWYVLAAEPGARILRGLRPDPATGDRRRSADWIRRAAADGSIADALEAVPAVPGECHVLPSGLCHALGGGMLVAEVQTPSDTTFRLWDWGRDGRELHVEAAVECLTAADAPVDPPPPARAPDVAGPAQVVPLAQTPDFDLDVLVGGSGGRVPVTIPDLPVVLIAVSGSPRIETAGGAVTPAPGTTVLLPAACRDAAAELGPGHRLLRAVPAEDGRRP